MGFLEEDGPGVEVFAEGVLVGAGGDAVFLGRSLGRVPGGLGWPVWRDDLAPGIGEGEPVGVIGVAGDSEPAFVVGPVVPGTQADEVSR